MSDNRRGNSIPKKTRRPIRAKKDESLEPALVSENQDREDREMGDAPTISVSKELDETQVSTSIYSDGDPLNIAEKLISPSPPEPTPRRKGDPGDEFLIQTFYDKAQAQFVGFVVEIPEIRTTGKNRSEVLLELEEKLDSHLEIARRRGEKVVESFQARQYPEKLEVPISQNLYRKLDVLSRQEKTAIDKLVTEILSAGIERRIDSRPNRNYTPQQPQPGGHQRPHSHHHRQHGSPRRHNVHETLGSRENFMEYVRNLEKGNWNNKK